MFRLRNQAVVDDTGIKVYNLVFGKYQIVIGSLISSVKSIFSKCCNCLVSCRDDGGSNLSKESVN